MKHTKPPKSPCSHRVYQMDCAEYDRLLEHAGGRCQICRAAPEETKHRFLVVDHDFRVGQWAVRGLLCSPCNTNITVSPSGSQEFEAYMEMPWWRKRLSEQGLSAEMQPEPPVGSEVLLTTNRRRWRREGDRWHHLDGYPGSALKWEELNRRYGPHRLRILTKTTAPERPAGSEETTG